MKYSVKLSIVYLLLLATSLPTTAQTLRDYIRSRSENSDSLLLKAISPSLSIIRQQYRLELNGEFFGKNNKPFYGESYTLGVKVSGATILQNRVVAPWMDDEDYKRVNQSGKYHQVLFWSLQRSLKENVYQPIDLELESRFTEPLDEDSLLYMHRDKYNAFGISLDESPGEKSGYMVWAYSSTHVQDSTMNVSLRQTSFKVEASQGNTKIKMTPNEPAKIIGGLFVVPVFEAGGVIHLTVAGIASRTIEGNWVLQLLAKQTEQSETSVPQSSPKSEDNKKEQQGESSSEEPTPVG